MAGFVNSDKLSCSERSLKILNLIAIPIDFVKNIELDSVYLGDFVSL